MIRQVTVDGNSVQEIDWAKRIVGKDKVKVNNFDKFFNVSEDADTYIAFGIKSLPEIPLTGFRRLLLTSKTFRFYDLYDVFEPITDDFKIYNLSDTILVAEVNMNDRRRENNEGQS